MEGQMKKKNNSLQCYSVLGYFSKNFSLLLKYINSIIASAAAAAVTTTTTTIIAAVSVMEAHNYITASLAIRRKGMAHQCPLHRKVFSFSVFPSEHELAMFVT
ncbi:hypothetical protein E2C01_033986 [Portunus trituberculatus]|uniref:Uncharacterized protein n=1 Tax=Portunus trituberculatus TaxID=210409 RepID=A0A5B7F5K7_PORTR|nr:hypothetical protein [Portunus trituberculatus]